MNAISNVWSVPDYLIHITFQGKTNYKNQMVTRI